MKLEDLSKKQKIELIRKLSRGEVAVVNGEIITGGTVLVQKDGSYSLNGSQVELDKFKNLPDFTVIILPDNGR